MRGPSNVVSLLVGAGALLAACGNGAASDADAASESRPTIVVSTNIMGDVVENVVGDAATVVTIMPVGADPHDFQPSAQQIAQLNEADVVITNGGGFEEGLLDVIESAEAEGATVFEAISAIETLGFAGHGHDEHHDDDEHEEEHDEDGADPHFFSDPLRVAAAAQAISELLISDIEGIDEAVVRAATDAYLEELDALHDDIGDALGGITPEDRVLVTNHDVLTYFADRYNFEIIGTVFPGGTTIESADAEALAGLASIVEAENVPAVFTDTSSSDELAQTLALEVGGIEVVALYSESLGPEDSDGSTYLAMMRTNAQRISQALTR